MKIVVTGFQAFLKHVDNPTEAILKRLPKVIEGNTIIPLLLPVEFDQSFNHLLEVVEIEKPQIVIMLGLAGGRKAISLERIAINVNHSSSPDNKNVTKHHETINEKGKNAYFTSLPIEQIQRRLKEKKIPCEISNSAGTYVCNNVFYQMMNYIEQSTTDIIAGFIHIPYMTEQSREKRDFSLDLSILVEAVIEVIYTCIKRK